MQIYIHKQKKQIKKLYEFNLKYTSIIHEVCFGLFASVSVLDSCKENGVSKQIL